jgi:hypothetical protein
MILKCNCGATATAQPFRLSIEHRWICPGCRDDRTRADDVVVTKRNRFVDELKDKIRGGKS